MSDAPRPMSEILAELQAAADEVTAQRLHFGYIADTIRVNALRNGATTEQVEDFTHGRASFVNWMAELIEARGKTEIAALQAENSALQSRAEAAEAALAAERAKVAKLVEALTPFSEMAGEMFSRNWNDDGVAISMVIKGGRMHLTFKEFRAARAAIAAAKGE